MAQENQDGGLIRRYLLGRLSEDELDQLEERMMADNEFFDRVLLAEDEMIEDYVHDELSASDRGGFEASFLSTPEGRQQVAFAKALSKYVKDDAPGLDAGGQVDEEPVRKERTAEGPRANVRPLAWWRRPDVVPYFKMAAAVVIVIGLGVGIWRMFFYQSEVSKGTAALAYAYRDQRPLEARISGFNYARASTTRGGEAEVDRTARNLAEGVLLEAVLKHPNAATHHAAGRLYLAEKKFDEAIKQFEEALKEDPNNAQIHGDLGAALLERTKVAQADGKAEELGKALQQLSIALELDPSLSEALFNRALCLDAMMAYGEAKEAWNKYLESDSISQWADEARRRLQGLEEQKKQSSDKEALFDEFISAFRTNDKERAWDAYTKMRYRTGHYLVETLVDQFLQGSTGVGHQAADALATLSFAADLDLARADDHYLRDVTRYYSGTSLSQRKSLKLARDVMKSAASNYDGNRFDDARGLFAKAAQMYVLSGDTCDALFARSWEGFCLVRVPDTRASLALLQELSPIFLKSDYRWLYGHALNAIADVENSRDNLSEALSYSEQALKQARGIKDPVGILRNLGQLTSFYLQFGDYQRSLSTGFFALETARICPADAKQVWPLYFEMASAYLSLDSSSAALAFGEEALRLAIEAQFPLIEARSYERLGLIYQSRSEYTEGIRYAQLAVEVGQRLSGRGALNMTAGAKLNLAHVQRLTGNYDAAISLYDEAIALYEKLGLDIYRYEAHKGKLISFFALGDDSTTANELQLTMKLYEEYRVKIIEESNKDRFFDAGNDLVDIAVNFEYSKRNNLEAAYNYAEAARARSLFDLITGKSIVVYGESGPDNLVASNRSPVTLPDIRSQLPEDLQVVQYCVLDDKVICWVITRDKFDARHASISARVLDQMVRDYVGCLADTEKAGAAYSTEKGKALYDNLISPIESLLDTNKVICFVPDKFLNYAPFPALISRQSGRYLIEGYRLQFSPSTSVFLACTQMARERKHAAPERLLSIGDPDFDHEMFPLLRELSSARVEAERIAEYYSSKRVLVGGEARKEDVKKELPQADVVEFATHYVPNPKSPMLSRLLLARCSTSSENKDESSLSPSEIYGMKLSRTRLVVLSGCQTGVEQTLRGEGAISMARPFLAAGVPVVLASLWPVETDSTKDLMIAFHSYRSIGLSSVDALRKAQLEMLAKEPNGRSFTWAAFEIIGGYSEY